MARLVQRTTRNLGLNRSAEQEEIYSYIADVLGIKTKRCGRGSGRKNQFGAAHKGRNPLPIRNFHLLKAHRDPQGGFVLQGDGLQGACKECDKTYRRGRLDKWLKFYGPMSADEVRAHYKQVYGPTAGCSRCRKQKLPEEIGISKRMERGLHNVCLECSQSYSEAVGNRWVVYSPDGRNNSSVAGARCATCKSTKALHKDHRWPLSKGGTDFAANIQILCGSHNLSKSDTIVGITSLSQVSPEMICARYHGVLVKAKAERWGIRRFELEIARRVRQFVLSKQKMTDKELEAFFDAEKRRNNRKHGLSRAVRKFRNYSAKAILDINSYIAKSG